MKIVGTVHSLEELRRAKTLSEGKMDFVELRLDAFSRTDLQKLERSLDSLKHPCIVTIRHHKEGGLRNLSVEQRKTLFARFLPFAEYIDVELQYSSALKTLIRGIGPKVKWIASHHNFKRTPTLANLRKLAGRAAREGASIFKIAATTLSPKDVACLLIFLETERRIPVSVMGMGSFGKVSRLLFARAGSVLTYGCIGEPKVPGQWPIQILRDRINEIS